MNGLTTPTRSRRGPVPDPKPAPAPWYRSRALGKPRFRLLVVTVLGVAVVPSFVYNAVLVPLLGLQLPSDFTYFWQAAQLIASGGDPYAPTVAFSTPDPTRVGYIYPPLLAWLIAPATRLPVPVVAVLIAGVQVAALAAFCVLMIRALEIRDRVLAALLVILTLGFFPVVQNFVLGQINLVLLALSAAWFGALLGAGRLSGGVAIGVAVALKLFQAPLLLLTVWARRWRMTAAAGIAIVVSSALAVPQFLPEYSASVFPRLSLSSGFSGFVAPGATITRFLNPASIYGIGSVIDPRARMATLTLSVLVAAVTAWRIGVVGRGRLPVGLAAAAVVSAGPLLSPLSWPAHLVLLLLPLWVLAVWSIRNRRLGILGVVSAAWILMGPSESAFWKLTDTQGLIPPLAIHVWVELASLGIVLLWVTALVALRIETRAQAIG